MKKLKLDLNNVQVESFLTSGQGERMGTVRGHQYGTGHMDFTERDWSCNYPGCPTAHYGGGSCLLTQCPPEFE